MSARPLIISMTLLIGAFIGWLLINDIDRNPDEIVLGKPIRKLSAANSVQPTSERILSTRTPEDVMLALQAIRNERLVSFKNEEDYRDFLARLGDSKVRNLGQIDSLRAIRLGYDDFADFEALGLDPDDLSYNFPVSIPERGEVGAQEGIVGFGGSALQFLGIDGDNSLWGTGVKIAVIDTGIEPHPSLDKDILRITLVELAEGVEANSHGTSVASLIAGNHPNLRGVAPGADLISVRVADETGFSNSFLLAQGIIEAALNGAQIINISMGSDNDSPIVYDAVKFAIGKGAVILASSGNDGLSRSAFPGAYKEVISVGAVDALGQHLNFSNNDKGLAITAPGLQITAAFPGEMVTEFSGTSAAVAFPSGAIAAVMSQSSRSLNAQEAVNILINTSNEAGTPGLDMQYGNGILNVGRAINRDTPGINDLAVASQSYLTPTQDDASSGLQVSVENRGTEAVWNSSLEVTIDGGTYPVQISSLQPNERRVVTIPSGLQTLQQQGFLDVRSKITLSGGTLDVQPSNNARSEQVTLPSNGP